MIVNQRAGIVIETVIYVGLVRGLHLQDEHFSGPGILADHIEHRLLVLLRRHVQSVRQILQNLYVDIQKIPDDFNQMFLLPEKVFKSPLSQVYCYYK